MFVLYHKDAKKYLSLSEDGRKLTTEKTIRTSTAFPDKDAEHIKQWLVSGGVDGKITLHYVEHVSVAAEKWLEIVRHAKYSEVKKFQSNIETLALYMQGC